MAHSDEQWERISKHARATKVADVNGATIVLAHPGQELNMDPKYLMENFGITPDMVTTLDKSREAPRRITEDDLLPLVQTGTLQAAGVSDAEHQAALDRIAELEAELDSRDAEVEPAKGKAASAEK